jgi:RimJ/RimL family protein N-acetyltransferase
MAGLNTEAKLLLVRHAFETLGMNRVEFKTDARNGRSRAALLRIGAIEEGTFRSHMVMPDGHLRDSVYYRIVARDWPATKLRLEARLAARPR